MGKGSQNCCICAKYNSSLCTREQNAKRDVYRKEARGQPPEHIWFLVYLHVPKDKRMKLDHSGKKGIFVGYSDSSKAYRVYIPDYKMIEISRDVTFDKDTTFSRSW